MHRRLIRQRDGVAGLCSRGLERIIQLRGEEIKRVTWAPWRLESLYLENQGEKWMTMNDHG